jgi:hypothetical protein
MDKLDLFEKVEDYLRNRLPPEAHRAFEAEMAQNPELAEEVALHRTLMDATGEKDVMDLRELMERAYAQQFAGKGLEKTDLGSSGGAVSPASGMTVSYRRIYQWAAAASVLLVAAAGIWWATKENPAATVASTPEPVINDTSTVPLPGQKPGIAGTGEAETAAPRPTQPDPQRRYMAMANDYYRSPEFSNIRKGEGVNTDSLPPLERAKRAFTDHRYQQVVLLLQQPDPAVLQQATYLRGHAFFNLKNYGAAARDFRTLMEQESMEADDATWYLLLSTLAQKGAKDSSFQMQLKKIMDDDGHPFHAKAKELNAALQ